MAEKDKFDPESKLKELLPNAFDDKGEYKPIYTPTGEPKGSVSVEPAPSSFDEISPELIAAGTGTLGFLGGQKAKMIQQRVQPSARASAPPPSTVPPPASAPPAAGGPLASGDKWSSKVVGSMGPGGESVTEAARNYRIQQGLTPTETAQFKTNREGIILPNKTEAEQRMMQEARQKMLEKAGAEQGKPGADDADLMLPEEPAKNQPVDPAASKPAPEAENKPAEAEKKSDEAVKTPVEAEKKPDEAEKKPEEEKKPDEAAQKPEEPKTPDEPKAEQPKPEQPDGETPK